MKTNNWPRHPEINPTLKSSSVALTYLQQIADAGLPLCAAFGGCLRDAQRDVLPKDIDIRVWSDETQQAIDQLRRYFGEPAKVLGTPEKRRVLWHVQTPESLSTKGTTTELDVSIRKSPFEHASALDVAKDRACDSDANISAIAMTPQGVIVTEARYQEIDDGKILYYPSDNMERVQAYKQRMQAKFPEMTHELIKPPTRPALDAMREWRNHQPLSPAHITIFVDASLKRSVPGMGFAAYQWNELVDSWAATSSKYAKDSTEAELWTICAALERAHEKGWRAVSIKTDSAASIYNIATGKKDYPVVHEIEQLMNTLDVHIEWLDRDYNSIANGLARMALGLKSPALPGVSYSKLVKAISSWAPQASVYDQTPR